MDGRGEALDGVAAEVEFLTEEQAGGLLSQPSKVAQGDINFKSSNKYLQIFQQ